MHALHVCVPELSPDFQIGFGFTGPTSIQAYCKRELSDVRGLCRDAGIPDVDQRVLLGPVATRARLTQELAAAAKRVPRDGLFVLSFVGHGSQVEDLTIDEDDGLDEAWCLYDDFVLDDELGKMLQAFPKRSHVAVISDCCFSASMWGARPGPRRPWPNIGLAPPPRLPGATRGRPRYPKAQVALLGSAVGERVPSANVATLAKRVRRKLFKKGVRQRSCPDYATLKTSLVARTTVDDRPTTWWNPQGVKDLAPFAPLPQA